MFCKYRFTIALHILGIKKTFAELDSLAAVKQIRGCDTSQLAFMDKNNVQTTETNCDVYNYYRKGEDIDLAKDVCDNVNLIRLKLEEQELLKKYGILR